MDILEIENRIKRYESRLSDSDCPEDINWLQCQLDNLRFRIKLENLKRRAYEMQNKPSDLELLNKYRVIFYLLKFSTLFQ